MSKKKHKSNGNGGKTPPIIPILILCAIFVPGLVGAAIPLFAFYQLLKYFTGIDLVEEIRSFIGENFGDSVVKKEDPCGDEDYHAAFSEKENKGGYVVHKKNSSKEDPCGDEGYHATFGGEESGTLPKGRVEAESNRSGSFAQKQHKPSSTVHVRPKSSVPSSKEDPCGNEDFHGTFRSREQRFSKSIPDGKGLRIGGSIMAAVFGIGAVSEALELLPYQSLFNEDFIIPLLFALCGVGVAMAGRIRFSRAKHYRKLRTLIGEQTNRISIRSLAEAMPCSEAKADKLVQEMIDAGLLTPNAYIDGSIGYLILDGMGVEQDADHTAEPPPKDIDDEMKLLSEIRRVNDSIPDPVLSRKISRIEEITGQILDYQKKHPERSSELRKFLNYYLPTTLRILNTYAEIEEKRLKGDNVTATKKRIEGMMDKVVEGFETQLDQLFAGDMMDISSDISVMEKMMSSDGLTGNLRVPKEEEPTAADTAFEKIRMTLEPEQRERPVMPTMPTPPTAPPVPPMPTVSDADRMFQNIGLTLEPEKEADQPETPSFGMGFGGQAEAEAPSDADQMFQSIHHSLGQNEEEEDWQSGFYRFKNSEK